MPASVREAKRDVIENSAVVLTGLILDMAGDPVVPADITSILLKSFDLSPETPTLVTPTGGGGGYSGTTLDPDDVIIDPVDTGFLADEDPDGINLRIDLDGSFIPNGGRRYRIEAKITPVTGDAFYLLWQLNALEVYSE